MDLGTMEEYWREIAKTAMKIQLVPSDAPNTSPEGFVRGGFEEMQFMPQRQGEFEYYLILAEGDIAARMRKIGKHADAKKLASQMVTEARELVANYSNDFYPYLGLSEAYVQVAKNAWQPRDNKAIEAALREALIAVERALAMHSENAKVRAVVADRRRRLANVPPAS
jgi:hypothetical protein